MGGTIADPPLYVQKVCQLTDWQETDKITGVGRKKNGVYPHGLTPRKTFKFQTNIMSKVLSLFHIPCCGRTTCHLPQGL
jgi:hypothetical protein